MNEDATPQPDEDFFDIKLLRERLPRLQDPLALVLRGHILIENSLIDLLRYALPRDHELTSRLGYQHRVELTLATCLLPSDLRPALEYIADLRNRYAHDLHFQLSTNEQDELIRRLPRELFTFADFESHQHDDFPEPLRRAITLLYIFIRGQRKTLADDAGRLVVMTKSSVRSMLEAAFSSERP